MATPYVPYVPKPKTKVEKYGRMISPLVDPIALEIDMIRKGGQWQQEGKTVGLGLFYHFKQLESLLWPHKKWHKWSELVLENYLKYRSIGCMGPASCVAGHTRIENPLTGDRPTIKELCDSNTRPWVMTLNGPVLASVPFVKGFTDLYEVTMRDGTKFTSTGEHRVLTSLGFRTVSSCEAGTLLCGYDSFQPQSNSECGRSAHVSGAESWRKIIQDSQCDCQTYPCSCGEPPHGGEGAFSYASPSPRDAQEHTAYACVGRDGWEHKPKCSHPYPQSAHLPILSTAPLSRYMEISESHHACGETHQPGGGSFLLPCLSRKGGTPPHSSSKPVPNFYNKHRYFFSSCEYKVRHNAVSSIRWIGKDYFYDLQVPNHHHYFAEGSVHHNSGKTFCFATEVLADYYCFSDCTTIICCSTTREMLEQRIWGEVKKHHLLAKATRSWIPGFIKESRQRIVSAARDYDVEGMDVRNGIVCVPCKRGNDYVGLGDFAGMKNKRMRLLADELHLLPRVFVDAISNLDKNPDFKAVGLGNPKDTTDALGIMCEPSAELGGWDGGIDQSAGTKTWPTRRPQGVCIQLPGSDSPNLDGKLGIPLITQADIDRDVAFYGTDSIWVTMMDEGKMPRGQGSRRVLTRNMAIKNRAMEDPIWRNSNRVRIACLDAAYKGVGGDRCVYAEIEFGDEIGSGGEDGEGNNEVLVNQAIPKTPIRPVMALLKMEVVPLVASSKEESEEQIVNFVREHCQASGIPPEKFFYDSGMRTGLVQAFSRLWSPFVVSIDCGGPASEKSVSEQIPMPCKDYYFNYVTEMWYSVRYIVESGQFRGMTEDVLMEFCQREWGMSGRNKIQVEPKADMKLKTGRSPDLADTVAIGVEGARRLGFTIKNLGKQVVIEREDWLKGTRAKARESMKKHELTYD
jgi:hypothetical protein